VYLRTIRRTFRAKREKVTTGQGELLKCFIICAYRKYNYGNQIDDKTG
jgi:hypothetical protein